MNLPMTKNESLKLADHATTQEPTEAETAAAAARADALLEHLEKMGFAVMRKTSTNKRFTARAIIAGHMSGGFVDATPFGERVKITRKKLGITQVELAKRLGMSQPGVQQIEKSANMEEQTARKLAEALGVTLLELFTGKVRQP